MESQVGPGTRVTLTYHAYDADGELLFGPAPLRSEFVFGFAEVPERVERALDGLSRGGGVEVTLEPEEAFGLRDEAAVADVDRGEFPPDIAPGDVFEAEREDGSAAVLKVLCVSEDSVKIDLNHPLAGQLVRLELNVEGVRPATHEELTRAERALIERSAPTGRWSATPGVPLVPVGRLRRGPIRRYDRA